MRLLRAFALIGVLGLSFFVTGCGGQSTATPPVTPDAAMPLDAPASDASASTGTAGTAISTMSTTASLVGKVVYMTYYSTTHEFEVKTSSGSVFWVAANSATKWTYNGLTLKLGVWTSVNGTKTSTTVYSASSISLSSSAPSSSTTSGGTVTPTSTSGVPKHVQTAEYLTTSTEVNSSPSKYAPYLTWAYAVNSKMGPTQAAGIKTVLYASPIMPNSGSYEYSVLSGSYPSVRAVTCAGAVVKTWAGKGLLNDPTHAAAAKYYQTIVNHVTSQVLAANPGYSKPWNLVYIDNDGPLYGASATPCNYTATTWSVAQDNALATTGQKFILNSLSVAEANVPTFVARLAGSAITGGEFEECFMTSLWGSEELAQLQAIAQEKREGKASGAGFWCYADNTGAAASTVIPERLYIYASFLLTYDVNYSVFQESFTTPSTFKVYPETGFVPMSPVSVPTTYTALRTTTGAYLQRYNSCYYRGSLIGRCEIIVNPSTASSVAVPNPWALRHRMVLSGGGVLDGGTATFTGTVPTSMGPKSGLILTP